LTSTNPGRECRESAPERCTQHNMLSSGERDMAYTQSSVSESMELLEKKCEFVRGAKKAEDENRVKLDASSESAK
jgi:hypothetical protein